MYNEIDDIYQALMGVGLSLMEIEQKIKTKAEEFQGFMSKEAILFLIAKEYNLKVNSPYIDSELYDEFEERIDYDEFTIRISEIQENLTNIVLLGRIEKKFGIRNFVHKDNTLGIVGSFLISDGTGRIKIVLWGDQSKIMENTYFQKGEIIRIIGGYSKRGINNNLEVHLGRKGKIILAPNDVDLKKFPLLNQTHKINFTKKKNLKIRDLKNFDGFIKSIEGVIENILEFKEFNLDNGEKTFLFKFVLKDDTSSINVAIWGLNAIEYLKRINQGEKIKLYNVKVKFNKFTQQNEISFIRNSQLIKN
ncbi:MAG: hypothetical protein ACFFDK_04015 [Promethearchaeota archaeon]